jgi:hypothetical protein
MPIRTVTRHKVSIEPEIVALQCNVCGVEEPYVDRRPPYDMHVISVSGGWGDKFPGDCETITFVVHGKCLEAWTETFKLPVESRHRMGPVPPIPCTHSETGEAMIMQWGWLRKASENHFEPEIEDLYTLPHTNLLPKPGVYEHFKGGLYHVFNHGWDVSEPHEAYVVYQALYGESQVWVRPARVWAEQVERDGYSGPRFKVMYEMEGAPMENKYREPE